MRDAILARLREQLATPHPPLRPLLPLANGTPRVGYAVDVSDPVAAFARALTAVAGVPHLDADVPALLAEVCQREGVRRAAVSEDSECAGVAGVLTTLGVEVVADAASADLGVTGAVYGIALTGSVVVDSTRAGGRVVSLLPRVHLALLSRANIVATPGDVLRSLRDLPSNLVVITGPSRSADIELHMTLGVHGPQAVHVGVLA